jgi:methanogenic corrinoid protein MtbC1
MTNELTEAMVAMKEQEAFDLAEKMLQAGESPLKVLELCRQALEVVGKRFEEGTYFLPELILAGQMLKQISTMAQPYLRQDSEAPAERRGKVVIGTVEGDIHDIGKDIVVFLLDVNGFEVHDLGVDVPRQKFVEAIEKIRPQVVAMSALLTTAFESLKSTVEAIAEAGLRDQVKIMIGGGAVSDDVRKFSGADAYGEDAVSGVTLAKKWVAAP